jgi:hypothetical protein
MGAKTDHGDVMCSPKKLQGMPKELSFRHSKRQNSKIQKDFFVLS